MNENLKINMAIRFFLLVVAAVIWLGIWLTGFPVVHWLLYVIAGVLTAAAILGICPGMFISRTIFKGNS